MGRREAPPRPPRATRRAAPAERRSSRRRSRPQEERLPGATRRSGREQSLAAVGSRAVGSRAVGSRAVGSRAVGSARTSCGPAARDHGSRLPPRGRGSSRSEPDRDASTVRRSGRPSTPRSPAGPTAGCRPLRAARGPGLPTRRPSRSSPCSTSARTVSARRRAWKSDRKAMPTCTSSCSTPRKYSVALCRSSSTAVTAGRRQRNRAPDPASRSAGTTLTAARMTRYRMKKSLTHAEERASSRCRAETHASNARSSADRSTSPPPRGGQRPRPARRERSAASNRFGGFDRVAPPLSEGTTDRTQRFRSTETP